MFYELKKDGALLQRLNVPAGKDGKSLAGKEADVVVLEAAKKAGATEVVTSDGRKVL